MTERSLKILMAHAAPEMIRSNLAVKRSKTLKVLVSAFAVSPSRGSEYAVGWEWVKAIAGRHSVWVITREPEREEIEAYLRDHPGELTNVSFHFVPWHEPSYSGVLLHVVYRLRYVQWQKQCFAVARKLDAEVDFDIIHHLNTTGFREPGFLWKLGKPFVWGPVLGLRYFQLKFLRLLPISEAVFQVAKNLTTAWMMHIARRPKQAALTAASIIAGTRQDAMTVNRLWQKSSIIISPVTPPEIEQRPPVHRDPDHPLRLIWCGRIDSKKALRLLLLSLGRLKGSEVHWKLLVIGTGLMEDQCRKIAVSTGIAEHCKFLGAQPRDKVLDLMRSGHVFVHSSLSEGSPTTVVEAMRMGLPPVGLDHCGFGDAVNDRCGILIPPTSIESVVAGFAEATRKLWRDEELRYKMALAAQQAAAYLSWEHKIAIVDSVYKSAQSSIHRVA